jgi:hypothetical protein
MTLMNVLVVVGIAGLIVLFGAWSWLEGRRLEARRRTDAPGLSDPSADGASQESRGRGQRDR